LEKYKRRLCLSLRDKCIEIIRLINENFPELEDKINFEEESNTNAKGKNQF